MKRFTVSLLFLVTALVTGSISASQLRITSISTINTLCQAAASGTIQVTVAGGTSPYTVSIIGPTPQQIAGVPGQTLFEFINVAAGAYNVTVIDSAPFSVPATGSIQVATACPVSVNLVSFVHPGCNGASTGSITLDVTGGPAPATTYLYSIVAGGGQPSPLVPDGSSHTFSNLPAGQFSVVALPVDATLADVAACGAAADVLLVAPAPIVIAVLTNTSPTCNGGSDGSLTVSVNGGTAPYTVSLINSAAPSQTGPGPNFTFTNLSAANYSVNVTDANNCTAALAVTVTQPQTALSIVTPVTTIPVTCFGGSDGQIAVSVNNTTGQAVQFAIIAGPVTRPFQTSNIFTGLPAGTYTVQAAVAPVVVPPVCAVAQAVVQSPAAIVITTKITNQDIVNDTLGSLVVTVTGGIQPYKITLTPGGATQSGNGPFTFSNLVAGTYTITVVDANGCTQTATAIVACTRGTSTNPITNFITTVLCKGQCTLPTT